MRLSKQLYIIISFIFIVIFLGNFIISITNFKEYLVAESGTKSQDTATSLGMSLKNLIDDKQSPEITSTLRAIANSGFYKEIRLEDSEFVFTKESLLKAADLDITLEIKELSVDKKFGVISSSEEDDLLASELSELEGLSDESESSTDVTYSFVPAKDFPSNQKLEVKFIANDGEKDIEAVGQLDINRVLVKIDREEKFDSVPQWFVDLIPMTMVEKKSEISNGWKTQAIIYVSANAGEAYSKLYSQAKKAIYYAIVAFTLSFGILIIFLRLILKPLQNIEKLAQEISTGNFVTIEKLPWTLELKNVSISMNDMSNKIKNMITKLNSNLQKMTEQLSQDDLTGLQLEQTFQTDMKQMFIKKHEGYIFSIKIHDLADFAKHNSNKDVNNFLKDFANVLKTCDEKASAYRFFGSTFAMICKRNDDTEIKKVAEKLKTEFNKLSEKYNKQCVAHMGVTPFNPISTTDDILAQANEAHALAMQIGFNEASIRDKGDLARDMLEWKDLIFDIVDSGRFEVGYINKAMSTEEEGKVLLEEAFTSAKDNSDNAIPIGTFVSIAEKYEKVIDFDKAVVKKVVEHIKTNGVKHDILINLAFDSLVDSGFKGWIRDLLSENSTIAAQLAFSVTAYGCTKDVESFKTFANLVHENGGKIIIKRFESKFIPLDSLKEFNLDYIRLARDYTTDIVNDPNKQNFVDSICELAKLINIKVFAESVKDEENFEKLKSLGIYGASL